MMYNLKYSQFNERSILIEWPSVIDQNTLKSVLNFKNDVHNYYIKQKVDIITTYNSILIIYKYTIDNINDKFLELKSIFKGQHLMSEVKFSTWEIPVCYDEDFGLDLESLSIAKELSKSQIVSLHTKAIYTVFFIGFLPGFLYLGGLESKLHFKRKSTPSLHVKKGAVAIGGQQTGIYPQDSPGGWHIIGSTPIEIFNATKLPPCNIKAGDKLRFQPIDKHEYLDIKERVAKLSYQLQPVATNA